MAARAPFQLGTPGRRLGGDDRVLDPGGRQRGAVPARTLEAESGIIKPMRFLRVVLALAFGLAMAGQDTRACSHHHDAHHKGAQDSAPQACCPASVGGSLPTISAGWVAAPLPVVAVDVEPGRSSLLPSRKHLLPFALAPPQALG